MELPDTHAGFFGKVTSHGDFVSRRLPASFRQPWDDWLQQGLQGSRKALGDAWLETYLSSPIWRFALAPGVCDGNAWAGVLMPSVDRVGRQFPLTIAFGMPGDAPLLERMENAANWFDRLEMLALASLEANFSLDDFDAALRDAQLLPAAAAPANKYHDAVRIPIAGAAGLSEAIPALSIKIANATLAGHGLWWTDGSPRVEPSLLVCRGLPSQVLFTSMLNGS